MHEAMVNLSESAHTDDMGDYFLINPHSTPRAQELLAKPTFFEYTSDNPNHWLTDREMWKMIYE